MRRPFFQHTVSTPSNRMLCLEKLLQQLLLRQNNSFNYLRRGSYAFVGFCVCVCACVRIISKSYDRILMNFVDRWSVVHGGID